MRKIILLTLILLLALAVPGWAVVQNIYVDSTSTVPGTVRTGAFTIGEVVWQDNATPSSVHAYVVSSTPFVITGIVGTPSATNGKIWTGATSTATFTQTGAPAANGKDTAPGDGSLAHPYATINQVNTNVTLAGGDTVYFVQGGKWFEVLNMNTSGSAGAPITFTSYTSDLYGAGMKPEINASTNLTPASWTASGDYWKQNLTTCYMMFENNLSLAKASSSALTDGYWFLDATSIYYRPTDGSNPTTNHKIAARLFNTKAVDCTKTSPLSYVTFNGISFVGHGFYNGTGRNMNHIIVQNCDFTDCNAAFSLTAGNDHSGISIKNCNFTRGGVPVYLVEASNYTWTACDISNNTVSSICRTASGISPYNYIWGGAGGPGDDTNFPGTWTNGTAPNAYDTTFTYVGSTHVLTAACTNKANSQATAPGTYAGGTVVGNLYCIRVTLGSLVGEAPILSGTCGFPDTTLSANGVYYISWTATAASITFTIHNSAASSFTLTTTAAIDRGGLIFQNLVNSTVNSNLIGGGNSFTDGNGGITNWSSVATVNNSFRYNYIHDIPGPGMNPFGLADGGYGDVSFNIVANCGKEGIRLTNRGDSTNRWLVYNNTIYNCLGGFFTSAGTIDYYTFKNNIVHTITAGNWYVRFNGVQGTHNVLSNNYYYPGTGSTFMADNYTSYTFANWKNVAGYDTSGSDTKDPQFVNAGAGTAVGLKLQDGSPAAIAGTSVGLIRDYGGFVVPGPKGKYSLGAWQDESIGGTPTDLMGWFDRVHKKRW